VLFLAAGRYLSGPGSPHAAFDFGRTLAEPFVSIEKVGHVARSSVVVTRWIDGDSDRWKPVVPWLVRTENLRVGGSTPSQATNPTDTPAIAWPRRESSPAAPNRPFSAFHFAVTGARLPRRSWSTDS